MPYIKWISSERRRELAKLSEQTVQINDYLSGHRHEAEMRAAGPTWASASCVCPGQPSLRRLWGSPWWLKLCQPPTPSCRTRCRDWFWGTKSELDASQQQVEIFGRLKDTEKLRTSPRSVEGRETSIVDDVGTTTNDFFRFFNTWKVSRRKFGHVQP